MVTHTSPDLAPLAPTAPQVGLHFFNPVQLMKLVEIVNIPATEPAVFEAVQGACVRTCISPYIFA
jgi:hypothetical protein